MAELYGNWSRTTRQSLAGVQKMGAKIMIFVLKTRNVVLKTRKFVSKSRHCVSKTRNCLFVMLNFAGGFTWSNFNCMLDTDNGYSCPPSDLAGCGLHKTEGVPRGNNVESAALWHPRHHGWDYQEYPFAPNQTSASERCKSWSTSTSNVSLFLDLGSHTHRTRERERERD